MRAYARFRNAETEKQMQENGFAVVRDFLSSQQVTQLSKLYAQYHQPQQVHESGMWNSVHDLDVETGNRVSGEILAIVLPAIEKVFEKYWQPTGTFMSKCPNNKSFCENHRDNSIFDEDKYGYRNLWMPLVDTDKENGGLFIVPKSHKVFTELLPPGMTWPYQHYGHVMSNYIQEVPCIAGDLVVYDQCLLHGSWENKSNQLRPVVHMGILPENAELVYYKTETPYPHLKVSSWKVSPDFFFNSTRSGVLNETDYIKTFEVEYKDYTEAEFDSLFKNCK